LTVIVAWKCTDGVVVGADSAATLGSFGITTVKESTDSKLAIIRETLILGVSGPVALSQKYEEALKAISFGEFNDMCNKPGAEVASYLSAKFWEHAQPAYQRAAVVVQATQNRAALNDAIHSSVVAVHTKGRDRLFQFTDTCSGEEATEQLPYLSIGSGQQNADPFLAFLRRTFWPNSMPNLSDGIFACLWTLTETINSAPSGIDGPITLAVLESGKARMLDKDELKEHVEAIDSARAALRTFQAELGPPKE
jgi:20S proteasome alpha/beta subunit